MSAQEHVLKQELLLRLNLCCVLQEIQNTILRQVIAIEKCDRDTFFALDLKIDSLSAQRNLIQAEIDDRFPEKK
jgi:hypothetical protein